MIRSRSTDAPPIPRSKMRLLKERRAKETSADLGGMEHDYPLALARIQHVDYKALTVTIMTLGPGPKKTYNSIPITFPHMGRRSFMGAMPEVDDLCIIGYSPKESGYSRQPYILAWLPPGGTTLAYNWETASSFSPNELPWTPAIANKTEGLAGRVRHKLRHMNPGNVVASSSQGSDLVLDESASLMNRRGNELVLRDQDQALLIRTLQQFHTGAGFRVYGGMVQRDARFLSTQMVSDGTDWASPQQRNGEGLTVPASDLSPLETATDLTPADVFMRNAEGVPTSGMTYPSFLDPYDLLNRGLFVDALGNLYGEVPTSNAIYGGKPYYRVSRDPGQNAAVADTADTLTEYRIEISHTSDGTLPVSEQTDGFDVDRLPQTPGTTDAPAAASPNAPFVEFVLGTVVGNDPFGPENTLYGLPLTAQVFDGDKSSPSLATPTNFVDEGLLEQLAALLRVRNPNDPAVQFFLGLTKGGSLRLAVNDAQLTFANGLRVDTGSGPFDFTSQQSVSVRGAKGRPTDNVGVEVSSDQGAVLIRGGGTSTQGAQVTEQSGSLPGLQLESTTNTHLTAKQTVKISGNAVKINDTGQVAVNASTGVTVESAGAVNITGNTLAVTSTGRADFVFGGPKNGQPTNAPIRTETFVANPATGFVGGVADLYTLPFGDRSENYGVGNLFRTFGTGSQVVTTGTGSITFTAGGASVLQATPTNAVMVGPTVQVSATAGSATLSSTVQTTVSAGTSIALTAPTVTMTVGAGPIAGLVLTDGCIDGLTGLPFRLQGTFGVPQVQIL
jgi:hypothetical protein